MVITTFNGSELVKSRSNSPEDFFNRSEITYKDMKGRLKTFSVLYLRYFEEKISELTPFASEPLYEVESEKIYLRDIVAILALLNHREYEDRHRVYINDEEQFSALFQNIEGRELETIITEILKHGKYELNED